MSPAAGPATPHSVLPAWLSRPRSALSPRLPHPAFSVHSKSSLFSSWNLTFGGRSSWHSAAIVWGSPSFQVAQLGEGDMASGRASLSRWGRGGRGLWGRCSPVQLLSLLQFSLPMLLEHVQGIASCQARWGDRTMMRCEVLHGPMLASARPHLRPCWAEPEGPVPLCRSVSRCASPRWSPG